MIVFGIIKNDNGETVESFVDVIDIDAFFHASDTDWIAVYVKNEHNEYDLVQVQKSEFEIGRPEALHPDGCHSVDLTKFRDCHSDGHYSCRTCSRNETV